MWSKFVFCVSVKYVSNAFIAGIASIIDFCLLAFSLEIFSPFSSITLYISNNIFDSFEKFSSFSSETYILNLSFILFMISSLCSFIYSATSSTVTPSTPATPLFDTTFLYALFKFSWLSILSKSSIFCFLFPFRR